MAKMPDPDVLKEFQRVFTQAQEQRYTAESDYAEIVNLEAGIIEDFTKKGESQSGVVLPDVVNHLRGMSGAVKQLFEGETRWPDLKAQSPDPDKQLVADVLGKESRYQLEQDEFFSKLKHATYQAGRMGYCPLKVEWVERERPAGYGITDYRGGVKVDVLDPIDFWLDPTGYDRVHFYRRVVTKAMLKNKAAEWKLNEDAVAEALTMDMPPPPLSIEWTTRENMPQDLRFNNRENVELIEVCGNWFDQGGDEITKNGKTIIAQQRVVVKSPTEYKNAGGLTPYVVMRPVNEGGTGYPKTFIKPYIPLIVSSSELWNLTVDCARAMLPIWTLYAQAVLDPEVVKDGLFPGMTIPVSGFAGEAIQAFTPNGLNPLNIMGVFSMAQQQTQALNSGLIQAGLPSGRGKQTATEVMTAQQLNAANVASVVDGITDTALVPMVRRMLYLIGEYRTEDEWVDDESRWLHGNTRINQLQQLGLFEQLANVAGFCTIDISEPSKQIRRQMTQEGIMNVLKNVSTIAPGWLKLPALVSDFLRSLGFDPERYLNEAFDNEAFGNWLLQQGQGGAILKNMMPDQYGTGGMGGGMPAAPGPNQGPMAYGQPGPMNPGGMV